MCVAGIEAYVFAEDFALADSFLSLTHADFAQVTVISYRHANCCSITVRIAYVKM